VLVPIVVAVLGLTGLLIGLVNRDGGEEDSVAVPDVVGRTVDEAEQVLAGLDLLSEVTVEESDRSPGTVIRTDPAAGRALAPGSVVTLVEAVRAAVAVPDVVAEPVAAAQQRIATAGLLSRVVTEGSAGEPGTVVRTEPAAGNLVAPGSEVVLVVAEPTTVQVPEVTQLTLAQARREIEGRGLVVAAEGPIVNAERGLCQEGDGFTGPCIVEEQQPGPGAPVPEGSTVRLVVVSFFR
jgi:eukaryotic-like serine/threonine-protein kinase